MIARINGRLVLLLSVAAVLLIALVGWYAIVSPERSKAATLNGKIGDAQVKLGATQAFLRSGSGPRSVAELRRLRVAIPDETRMSEILRQLSWASGKAGVRIDGITPSAPVATAGGQAVPISLLVAGHYFGLGKFMHLLRAQANVTGGKLRASGRLYAVDGISFATGDTKGLITATISLDAFAYGAAPAAAVAPDGTTTSTDQTTTTGSP